MALLIVHLTDAHLDEQSRDFINRADAIVNAALSPLIEVTAIHIVFSGDLANKTAPRDFDVARALLEQLCEKIEDRIGVAPKVIIVAGNHDCDFSGDQSIREALLGVARSKPNDISGQIIDQIASPLAGFYELQLALYPDITVKNRWLSVALDEASGVRYVLLNSAVMSERREEPGKLYVPVPDIDSNEDLKTIFVMHHPYGWLAPDNARELAQSSAMLGDLFLMGHEHELWAQQVSDLYDDTAITYLRGHVLRDSSDPQNSAFQTIYIDKEVGFQPRSYIWKQDEYIAWPQKSKEDFLPWPVNNGGRKISISAQGFKYLNSAGVNFTHRRKEVVTLQDIFVWPSIKAITPERDTGNIVADGLVFSAERLLNVRSIAPVCVVNGAEQSGKSALAKTLTSTLVKKGFYPLLINASSISSWRPKGLQERIDAAIDELYGRRWREDYKATEPADRVLLIDDFDLLQSKDCLQGIKALRQHFGTLYLMLDSYPGMDLALNEFLRDENFVDSSVYEILPSIHHHRLEIIERWLMIGNGADVKVEDVKLTAAKLLKVVDETLGRNLIPAAPVFVLIILQRAELSQDLDTIVKNGSHGFLYESLITQALSGKVTVCNVVTSMAYLTAFAALLEVRKSTELSQVDFEAFHVGHCQRFGLRISMSALQTQLVEGDILDDYNGKVKFKYPYHYYYFVARSISYDDWSRIEPIVDGLVGTIHTERSANVLLFLAHLGRNPKVAEKILARSASMFEAYGEADLFANVGLFDKYKPLEIRQVLFDGTRAQALEQREMDESEAESASKDLARATEDRLKSRLDDALLMNAAFKTLQVLGQVLRNHAGEIERDDKRRMAEACVSLGLRVLGFLFKTLEESGDEMLVFRSLQIRAEREKPVTDIELADELAQYLPSMLSSITVGTIIKMANAIGSEDLAPTIDEVLSGSETRQLVRLAAHLEHFSDFPRKEILDFEEDSLRRGPVLPNSALRRFIIRRFYLFPVREELKRSILDRFKIKALPFQFLEQKKIGREDSGR